MATYKFSRGKKLVALCAASKSDHNEKDTKRSNNADKEYVCDLHMLLSEGYDMDFLSSPVNPVRVNTNEEEGFDSSIHSNNSKGITSNIDSSVLILTDISFNRSKNLTYMRDSPNSVPNLTNSEKEDTVSSKAPTNHGCLANDHNLTVPTIWLENNTLNTPQITSLLLDDDQRDLLAIEAAECLNAESEQPESNKTEQNKHSEETSGIDDHGAYRLVLNDETGLFEKQCLDRDKRNNEIVDLNLLSNKKSTNQQLRLLGKTYKGFKRQRDSSTGRVQSFNVAKRSRTMNEKPCHHGANQKSARSFLCSAVNEDYRNDLFKYFWQLSSWEAKKAYINGLVQLRTILKRRPKTSEVNATKCYGFDCFLPGQNGSKIRVCKSFFLATFDLKKDIFQEWIRTGETIETGTHKLRKIDKKQCSVSSKPLKSNSVYQWLEKLPLVPSHYCRSDSNRTYVEDTFISKNHMHKVYSDWCNENRLHAVTRKLFVKKLEEKKISIFKPRKDQCDTCVGYREGNISQDNYNLHIIKKDEARDAKKMAINEISLGVLVITMDMQSVLLCPKLLVSEQYYKMKLAIHNFTFYIKNNKDVHLYVWHEGEGGVTANNITSCIIHFLRENCSSYQKVYLVSDGCTYQNRNKVLCSALSNISSSMGIEIEQLILEKGHTMMEVDSVHSTLEKQFKPPIYSPTDYITRMRQARPSQPYIVNYLDYSFFKNYEEVDGNFSSIRPGKRTGDPTVNDIRGLCYKEGVVKYKLRHTDPFQVLQQRRCRSNGIEPDNPKPLYDCPLKIDSSKYASLQSLKLYMHKDYHCFYDNLHT